MVGNFSDPWPQVSTEKCSSESFPVTVLPLPVVLWPREVSRHRLAFICSLKGTWRKCLECLLCLAPSSQELHPVNSSRSSRDYWVLCRFCLPVHHLEVAIPAVWNAFPFSILTPHSHPPCWSWETPNLPRSTCPEVSSPVQSRWVLWVYSSL